MSSGMDSTLRYWRRELASEVRKIRALARNGDCSEAKNLYRKTRLESGTSLTGWDTRIRLGNEITRRCSRKGRWSVDAGQWPREIPKRAKRKK